MKFSDDHVDPFTGPHEIAFVGEHHPVFFVGLGGIELPQLADLLHGRYRQHSMRARRIKLRGRLVVPERLGKLRLEHAVAEANQIPRGSVGRPQVVDAPRRELREELDAHFEMHMACSAAIARRAC